MYCSMHLHTYNIHKPGHTFNYYRRLITSMIYSNNIQWATIFYDERANDQYSEGNILREKVTAKDKLSVTQNKQCI